MREQGVVTMARSMIANGVRSFYVEASSEHESATAGRVDGMASASIPGMVYLNVAEPAYAGEDLELPVSATVYLTPAMARELGTELITLAARVERDDVLGVDPA
jgi:hypothetical protein